jgi:hypothetical protein
MGNTFLKNINRRIYLYAILFCALVFFVWANYKTIIKASTHKHKEISEALLGLAEVPVIEPVKINFQDDKTSPPPGWLKDSGGSFGYRPGHEQNLKTFCFQLLYICKPIKSILFCTENLTEKKPRVIGK